MMSRIDDEAAGKRWGRVGAYALLTASPFLLLGILSLVIGRNAFDSYPVWSNELAHWRALYSWLGAGLNTGYNGMYEIIPEAGRLGTDGFTPLLLYGWFVRLFGLSGGSIPLCNAVWVSLAALVFCLLVKPKTVTALLLTGLIMGYAPIVLYCVTSMTLLFNFALVLLLLAFLTRYQRRRNPWMLALCCLTAALGCFYRVAYGLLFLPIIAVYSRFRFNWKTLAAMLAAIAIWLGCCLVSARYTAPVSQDFLYQLMRSGSARLSVKMLLSHLKSNLGDFFSGTGSFIQDAFRWLYCGTGVMCLLLAFVRVEPDQTGKRSVSRTFSGELFCGFLLLTGALGVIAALYETGDWVDYRLLSPFLWLVLAGLAIRGRRVIPYAALAACLVTLVLLASQPPAGAYADPERFTPPQKNADLSQAISLIVYEPDATDPFENTVRLDIGGFQAAEELHPGLGLQTGWFSTDTTGQSNWILTDSLQCVVTGYEPVLELPKVKLYRLITPYGEE